MKIGRTKILDIGGFDSSGILSLRGELREIGFILSSLKMDLSLKFGLKFENWPYLYFRPFKKPKVPKSGRASPGRRLFKISIVKYSIV